MIPADIFYRTKSIMRIRHKRHATNLHAARIAAGRLPNTDVELIDENDKVQLRPTEGETGTTYEAALKIARAVPLTKVFREKSADEIMVFLRGD